MGFLTAKQASELWGVSVRHIQDMCRNGKIQGAEKHGREWLIPAEMQKSINGYEATLEAKGYNVPLEKQRRVYNAITDIYKTPGSAEKISLALSYDDFSKDIFDSQLAFYRGDCKTAIELVEKHADGDTYFAPRIAIGWQFLLCAIYTGDIQLWKRGRDYMAGTVCNNEQEKTVVDFWYAAAVSAISDTSLFPDWFKRGDLTRLPEYLYSVAVYHYIKYLWILCDENRNERAIELMHTLPQIAEPLVSYVYHEKVIVIEIYLRLACGLAYHIIGKDELAAPHIERAVDLAVPDRLYAPIAEYRRKFGFFIDDIISKKHPEALAEIKKVSKNLIDGWTVLHNKLLGRCVSNHLSTREWQTARLAAYGLSNKEIADRMGVTVNGVKQALRMVMNKTGAESRSDIGKYI